MPDNHPEPHVPARWHDRLEHHPEAAVALMSALAGVGLILDTWAHATPVVMVPWSLGIPIGAVMVVAGVLAAGGALLRPWRHLEQHGWHLLISTSLILTAALSYTHAFRLVWWLTLMVAAVGLVRTVALARMRKTHRTIGDAIIRAEGGDL